MNMPFEGNVVLVYLKNNHSDHDLLAQMRGCYCSISSKYEGEPTMDDQMMASTRKQEETGAYIH